MTIDIGWVVPIIAFFVGGLIGAFGMALAVIAARSDKRIRQP